jgi:hypothetical protein
VTNWLTAAGLALFAGGLATLICFRAVLFGGGDRPSRRRRGTAEPPATARRRADWQAIEPPRRRPDADGSATMEPRRRRFEAYPADDHGGLASIGFATDEAPLDELPVHDDEVDYPDDDPEPPTVLDRSPRRVGHRAEGWVRPQYRDVQPAISGDYWTPPPSEPDQEGFHEPSARGYGWPVQVERLPPVPAYEPATGFDPQPVPTEPTEVVPAWSVGDERADRQHLPRSWSTRDDKPRRRPRPRPRPAASIDGNGVYVSRHAADPPR